MEKNNIKKRFPKLFKEIEEGHSETGVIIEVEKPKQKRKFRGYNPDVFDFLRRCKTPDEAREIIEYLKKRNEISEETAEELSNQLDNKGLRSFGKQKKPGYYEKEG